MSKQKRVRVGPQFTWPKPPRSLIGRPARISEAMMTRVRKAQEEARNERDRVRSKG